MFKSEIHVPHVKLDLIGPSWEHPQAFFNISNAIPLAYCVVRWKLRGLTQTQWAQQGHPIAPSSAQLHEPAKLPDAKKHIMGVKQNNIWKGIAMWEIPIQSDCHCINVTGLAFSLLHPALLHSWYLRLYTLFVSIFSSLFFVFLALLFALVYAARFASAVLAAHFALGFTPLGFFATLFALAVAPAFFVAFSAFCFAWPVTQLFAFAFAAHFAFGWHAFGGLSWGRGRTEFKVPCQKNQAKLKWAQGLWGILHRWIHKGCILMAAEANGFDCWMLVSRIHL